MNSNGLSGTLTVELGGLVFLDTLDLGGNAITGSIPPGIIYELRTGWFYFEGQLTYINNYRSTEVA